MIVGAYRVEKPLNRDVLNSCENLQLLDSSLLFGLEHVVLAMEKAEQDVRCGCGVSDDFFVETLVRASGQRQIKKAMEMFGLRSSREFVLISETPQDRLLKDLGAIEMEIELDRERMERLKKAYRISELEMRAVSDDDAEAIKALIEERIALALLS